MHVVASMLVLFCSVALSQVAPTSPKNGAPRVPQTFSRDQDSSSFPGAEGLGNHFDHGRGCPRFGGYDMTVSDGVGNTHFYAGSFANYEDSTIFRLSSDPDKHQVYRLPPELADGAMFGAFNVIPAGTVWVSVFGANGENFAYSFAVRVKSRSTYALILWLGFSRSPSPHLILTSLC